jgi:preprotein translocase subunit SecD
VWDLPVGSVSDIAETAFGYHLIYKKSEQPVKEYHVARILFKTKQVSDIVPPESKWKTTGLSGKQLKRAEVIQDSRTGEIQVSLKFDDAGTKLFGEITTRNLGKSIAIFLDNSPISIATVNDPILSGDAVIRGGSLNNLVAAQELAKQLNLGALPVPVELLSQKKVDATLGIDSLQKSFKAGIVGLIIIMIFMVVYYRLPGLLSVFSLSYYALLSLAFFKLMGVTLTLSGIAGFILSIGMAVDANILVFERLKEELRLGKFLRSAVEESFVRSWPSIRDGHITALISCVFLMWFGSGFVQGFAAVLAIGTLINLFTAITITRTIMRFIFGQFKRDRANWLFLGHTPSAKDQSGSSTNI